MMYDFHYPLGQGKLNEDTANYCAKKSGMGKILSSASPSLPPALSFQFKKEISGLPFRSTLLASGVHWLSINQRLLKGETTLSHQHATSWEKTSILTALHSEFSLVLYPTFFSLSLFLFLSISVVCHILNFFENQTIPGTVRIKAKAGIIIRSSPLPSIRGGKRGRDHKLTEYEKCFQKQPSQEFHW